MKRRDDIRSRCPGAVTAHCIAAVIVLILLYVKPSFSAPVVVDGRISSVNISQSLEYLEDREGALTPERVRQMNGAVEWTPNTKDYVNFGYTRSAYWFKFVLSNTGPEILRFQLEIDFPSLDYVDFYSPDGRGGYDMVKTGDRLLFETRGIRDRNYIFPVSVSQGAATYYLRIANGGSLRFKARLYTDRAILEDRDRFLPLAWFLYGMVLLTSCFYFILYIFMRDRVYLYFSLFALNVFLYQISLRGFAYQYFWPSSPWWSNVASVMMTSTLGLFSSLFLRKVLDTRDTSRILYYLYSFFGLAAFPVLAALTFVLTYPVIGPLIYYMLYAYTPLVLYSAVYYVRHGNRFARYFLAGGAVLTLTNLATTLMALGKLPALQVTEWSNEMGHILLILFASLGLVDRFNVMNRDLQSSQLSLKEKNEMLSRANREMEETNLKLDEANQKLEAANEELASTNEELTVVNEEFEAQNRELMRSSNALMESEGELKLIFNSSHDALMIHDMEGRILDVNDRMLAMYRLAREEALKLQIAQISAYGADLPQVTRYWRRVAEGEDVLFEWRARRPGDESTFDVEVGLKKLKWRGRDVILASVRDLTERKSAEAERQHMQTQLVQAQKIEAVGTLAGGIAHDFNNVLGGIVGSLNLIEHLLKGERLEKAGEISGYLETAKESSMRATDMTRQLLTLSRKSEMQMDQVSIGNSLKHVMNVCKNSFPKSVELDFRIGDDPLFVYADRAQIDQALLNLCVNASHAMTIMRESGAKQGGRLTVEARMIRCDNLFCALHPGAIKDSPYVMIRVEDTGVGMDEEVRIRIFEPFFTTKAQEEGTGLGLAVTYGIVKQIGGFIDVFSEPGRGSVFSVYLPLMEGANDSTVDRTGAIITGKGRILVVDDEDAILRITAGMLKEFGYEVITEKKADKAVQLFRRDHAGISAVVLDNSMPGMSGIEVLGALREIDPGVRVLLCSGYMDNATAEKARELGVRGIISKPFDMDDLSRKMHEILA